MLPSDDDLSPILNSVTAGLQENTISWTVYECHCLQVVLEHLTIHNQTIICLVLIMELRAIFTLEEQEVLLTTTHFLQKLL